MAVVGAVLALTGTKILYNRQALCEDNEQRPSDNTQVTEVVDADTKEIDSTPAKQTKEDDVILHELFKVLDEGNLNSELKQKSTKVLFISKDGVKAADDPQI
mmetsp:Transcript_33524/g.24180  ORF Transcript_33524/g.24180 Transcript_33524/m.24180 type:complete len:102 (-) Transcript_33524:1748-2053(-)|eukprot:CAMPEP_0116880748 /NCGR_PEP_ID=MMETSP0463-20121206/12727_1 /TAXON_ID=181622 /ORGANISM="Strombidinopsis sp, Strain SopsisLIS2011" /LENGTH=101 /DNA_ID=CAMNT_0004531737 /DNA_START=86 /DNA_END=391 /DNA_ORIENTATION=+